MAKSAKKKLGPGRHLSTIKRHRKSVKENQRNKPVLSEVRSSMKNFLQAIEGSDRKSAEGLFIRTQSLTDRAIKRGVIHARTGHRHIARLNRKLASLSS